MWLYKVVTLCQWPRQKVQSQQQWLIILCFWNSNRFAIASNLFWGSRQQNKNPQTRVCSCCRDCHLTNNSQSSLANFIKVKRESCVTKRFWAQCNPGSLTAQSEIELCTNFEHHCKVQTEELTISAAHKDPRLHLCQINQHSKRIQKWDHENILHLPAQFKCDSVHHLKPCKTVFLLTLQICQTVDQWSCIQHNNNDLQILKFPPDFARHSLSLVCQSAIDPHHGECCCYWKHYHLHGYHWCHHGDCHCSQPAHPAEAVQSHAHGVDLHHLQCEHPLSL